MRHRLEHIGEQRRAADPVEISLRPELLQDDRGVDPLAAVVLAGFII
jgi:hypothetical protein